MGHKFLPFLQQTVLQKRERERERERDVSKLALDKAKDNNFRQFRDKRFSMNLKYILILFLQCGQKSTQFFFASLRPNVFENLIRF